MEPSIRNVAIITKIGNSEAYRAAIKVATLLSRRKIKVHSVLPFIIDNATPIRPDELKDIKLDLVFAVGGDGTTLRAFRTIPGKVPLFSINSGGHRGIMSEIDADSIDGAIKAILAGEYFYDCRIRIQASINGKLFPPVLNEGMSCLILTPIASVNRMPQVVIPMKEILLRSTHESHLILDGQETFKVHADEPINILRSSDDAVFLRLQKKGMRQLTKLGFSRFGF